MTDADRKVIREAGPYRVWLAKGALHVECSIPQPGLLIADVLERLLNEISEGERSPDPRGCSVVAESVTKSPRRRRA
jgi:hypothetical protein